MALDSLQELMLDELRDIYHAELQIAKSLPRIARAVRTPRLRDALREHLADTEHQVERLERVFDALGERGTGRKSRAMQGLLDEGLDLVDISGSDAVRDAALIAAIQRIEHYEIATYGTVITHASMLGHTRIARLLEESLREEKRADERLTIIAEEDVNRMAVEAGRYADRGDGRSRDRHQESEHTVGRSGGLDESLYTARSEHRVDRYHESLEPRHDDRSGGRDEDSRELPRRDSRHENRDRGMNTW